MMAGALFILNGLGISPEAWSEEYWMTIVGIILFLMWLPPVKRNTKSKEGTQ